MKRRASVLTFVVVALLAASAMMLQAGSVPHLHTADWPGLYNQEHDLALLASLAGHGLPADAGPALTTDSVSSPVAPFVPEDLAERFASSGLSRAPPTA